MTKFTQEQLIQVLKVCDPEQDYSNHRRGSTFYVGHFVEITEEDVPYVLEEIGIDVAALVGKRIYANGTYDDDWGSDYFEAFVQEKTETVIPAWTEVIDHPETVKVEWSNME